MTTLGLKAIETECIVEKFISEMHSEDIKKMEEEISQSQRKERHSKRRKQKFLKDKIKVIKEVSGREVVPYKRQKLQIIYGEIEDGTEE